MTLRSFALSDIGRVRPENEDSFFCNDKLHIYGVADGIGGLPGGAQASKTAVFALTDWFKHKVAPGPFDYSSALAEANEKVFVLGRVLSPRTGIGTTLTMAHFENEQVVVLHVGDSFMFRLRTDLLDALTQEHNVENEMKARAARGQPTYMMAENRAALTRCVGQPPPLEGDIHAHNVESGDRYLICSDGVTRYVMPPELQRLLHAAATPEAICHRLVEIANKRGGADNATVVAVFAD
jgi:protein phosphatase